MSKKVLLIVVDALSAWVVLPAMAVGKLPTLRALAEAGRLWGGCISIFPSITPAATAAIATGRYPREHGLPGAYWYDTQRDQVVYYSSDFWAILHRGLDDFFGDLLQKMNMDRLRADTLFETVEDAGQRAACLNFLIYRGRHAHKLKTPLPLRLLPGVPATEVVRGPSIWHMGDLLSVGLDEGEVTLPEGLRHRFGFEDDNSGALLRHLAEQRLLPDFTLAYFPDNDFRSHEVGPENALDAVEAVDETLASVAESYGGLAALLDEVAVVVSGDHSQCNVRKDEPGINMDELLADFDLVPAGADWTDGEQLMACPNLRAVQVYFQQPTPAALEQVTAELLHDERIDQVLWRASGNERGFHVVTRERGRLHFWVGDDGANTGRDVYGCTWSWEGHLEAVDGRLADGTLTFQDYPNAFERIAGGLENADSGHLWATARVGYEFELPDTAVHVGGGSHGSLHALDSTPPLIVAGAPDGVRLPEHPRIVDLAPLSLSILGLTTPRAVDESHVCD